jgi:hypothetical protein
MAKAIAVTTENGKKHTDMIDNIVTIAHEPGEPAVSAQDAVRDDPGEKPSPTNPAVRPSKKGHPAIEAKAAVPGMATNG